MGDFRRSVDAPPTTKSLFPNTSWGLVVASRHEDSGRDALGALCRRYWTPIYACVRKQCSTPADAEDLVQGFFLHVVEHHTVARADPDRGRFRSFLLGALRWYLTNERDRDNAGKRGGASTTVPIDIAAAELSLRTDAGSADTFEMQFDRQWARALVANALNALRAEYAERGLEPTYAVLQPCLDPSVETPSYATLATQLDRSEGAVKVAVHRLRGRFRDVLRHEVELTVATAQEIEDELVYLRDVLASEPISLGMS